MALPPKQIGPEVMNQIGPPNEPTQQAGAFDFLNSMPLGLALMQAGLSFSDGTPAGQSFAQGLGLYQQMMNNQAASASAKRAARMEEAKFGLETFKAGEGEKERKVKREEIESKERIEANKLKALADRTKAAGLDKLPKGVDPAIWKQALDTATVGSEDMVVDSREVYKLYNSMVPEDMQVYMPVTSQDITGILGLMEENPDYVDQYLETATARYGQKGAARLGAAWAKRQEALAKKAAAEETKAAKKEESIMKLPTEFKTPVLNSSPTMQADTFKAMYPQAGAGNPWAGADPAVLKALIGR